MASIITDLLSKNTTDPRIRLEIGQKLLDAVGQYGLPYDSSNLTNFMDVMVQWLSGTNYKVALMALEILNAALNTTGEILVPYLIENLTILMERLGDAKEQVRQETIEFILKLMSCPGCTPQAVFERLSQGFAHKQWLVRVGAMQLLQQTLKIYGSQSLQLNKITPSVCKLVADPTSQVRDTASETLVVMYMYCGDKLLNDIMKRRLLPESKANAIYARLEEAKNSDVFMSAGSGDGSTFNDNAGNFNSSSRTRVKKLDSTEDINKMSSSRNPAPPISAGSSSAVKRASSAPPVKRAVPSSARESRIKRSASGMSSAGAVDEEFFYSSFEDVPRVQFYSTKEMIIMVQQIKDVLSDPNNDWEKRVEVLKKLRSLIVADACDYKEFRDELKSLEVPFQLAAKDLRSQVVREACITIAFLSEKLQIKFDHFAETVLHVLINLIQNSAKIMSSSGLIACRFIIKNTHAPRLIPLITSFLNSKSKELRRACCDLLSQMFRDWPRQALELNVQPLQESIRLGLSDADPEARVASRKAYWGFAEHFKEQAELLFQNLDYAKQRQLKGELSQSSSSGSIGATVAVRSSQENLRNYSTPGGYHPSAYVPKGVSGGRSTSDIDTGAAKRAMQRHMVGSSATRTSRLPASHLNSLPRSAAKPPYGHNLSMVRQSPSHDDDALDSYETPRSTRNHNKSVSQPGSRSNSPSRLPTPGARRSRPSNAGLSQSGSREQSPSSRNRRFSTGENGGGYGASNEPRNSLIEAIANSGIGAGRPGRISRERSEDVDSETSSVCSERNLDWELQETLKHCMATQWSERKDGLLMLQQSFKSGRRFSTGELKRICDVFSRLFVDPHHKTFTVFLDVLTEYLLSYRGELNEWLYVLLTRLLSKHGAETLASVQTKLSKTMEIVRDSFPHDLQFQAAIKYIVDPAQTPSLKVKVALLNYFNDLSHAMDAKDFGNSSDVRQAISKIIQWTGEQKSADVRRASQNLLLSLFSLNAPEFNAVLSTLSKSYQDVVYRLIQSQLRRQTGDRQHRRQNASPGLGENGSGHNTIDMDFVHHSLKKTSEEIQNYSFSGVERVTGSQDSGIVDFVDGFQKLDNDITNGRLLETLNLNTDEERQEEIISEILTEMSNHNRRSAERRKAMYTLKFMTRDGSFTLWDEHFKTILLIFLETLGDDDPDIRANALRVLREICVCQAVRFREYAELTMLKVLEAHKDKEKEVARAADECASILATHLPAHICLRVLNPVIRNDQGPALIAAVKMVTKVVEQLSPEQTETILGDVVPGVLQGYDNTESCVRKASVLCLVALHNSVGSEKLEPFLESLNSSKIKLLHLYIKKNQTLSPSPTSQI